MELTRRDALAVLATTGVTVGAGVVLDWDALREGTPSSNHAAGAADSSTADAPDARSRSRSPRPKPSLPSHGRSIPPR